MTRNIWPSASPVQQWVIKREEVEQVKENTHPADTRQPVDFHSAITHSTAQSLHRTTVTQSKFNTAAVTV